VSVSGQDGDAAALNRIALGTQTVDVWKDTRELGKAAGEAAVALANGTALADIEGTTPFDSPGGNSMTAIQLKPIPITPDNLNVVLDAGWIAQEELCQGVKPGKVTPAANADRSLIARGRRPARGGRAGRRPRWHR
jgi:D-xylose transport system substrate-binding protein